MSTLPQQEPIKQYTGDGVETDFIYNFLILHSSDIVVYVTPNGQSANPVADLVPASSYTVTGVNNVNGGLVQFDVAPANNSIITLVRNMQLEIETDFSSAQNFNGANLDTAFKRVTMMMQQLQGNFNVNGTPGLQDGTVGSLSRCLQYVVNTYLPNAEPNTLPMLTDEDNQVWVSQNGGIAVTQLFTGGDANALQILLANNDPVTNGAALIGYYDTINLVPTNVSDYLNNLTTLFTDEIDAAMQSNLSVSADDTGAVNALAITLSPALTAYAAYNNFYVKVANTNSGAATLAVNGLAARDIKYMDGTALSAGALPAGMIAEFIDNGTYFQLANPFIRPATSAETLTGTNTTLPITPAALAAAFATGANSVTLPGGLIVKWGSTGSVATGNDSTVTFATPFPTACLSLSVTPQSTDNITVKSIAVSNVVAASFKYHVISSDTDSYYIAIGH